MAITYAEAERLAVEVHGRSVTPSGSRLIDHVRRVAAHFDTGSDPETAIAAILHDTVEKGPLQFDDLRRAGVDDTIITIIDALTERAGETEHDYLSRCAAHPTALRIKRVDIADKIALHGHLGRDGSIAAVEAQRTAMRRLALLEHLAPTANRDQLQPS